MSWLTQALIDLKVRARSLFGRRRMRARLAEEMATHVAMREERLIASGVPALAARRQARREFGNMAALRDSAADMWKYGTVERFVQDVRYGARSLMRTPGSTAITIAILSLGIGVLATVFTVVNAYFLNRLPVADATRVVRVFSNRYSNTSQTLYQELRDSNSTLDGLAAFQMMSAGMRLDREIEHGFGTIVSGNYFSLLGIEPARGRLVAQSDDDVGAPPVVALSHRFWVNRFGASDDVVGRTLFLNDKPFTIVGVVQAGYDGAMAPLVGEFWVPLGADAMLRPALTAEQRRNSLSIHMLGRLKPGIDRARAGANLDTIGRQARVARGEPDRRTAVSVYPATMLHPEIARPVAAFLGVLMVVSALVLLIVCVNVANVVLARSAARQVELAIRQAIGAGRGRLVRQLLTESLLISAAGAAGGLALAFWLTGLMASASVPAPIPLALQLPVDLRVVIFLACMVVATTMGFGAAPALFASRVDLLPVIKGVAGFDRRHSRTRAGFLIAQVSMSVLLLVAAGLFIRAMRSAQSVDTGLDIGSVLTANIDLEARGYDEARGREFVRELVERLETSPGVVAANVLEILPLTISNNEMPFIREGDPQPTAEQPSPYPNVFLNSVGPGHFRTVGIRMIGGRDFTYRDTANGPRVGIVNETLAAQFWPGKTAVGQRIRVAGDNEHVTEIVGVVRDSQYVTVGEEPRPFLYVPFAQSYSPRPTILVRAAGPAGSVTGTLTRVVREMDSGLPVFNIDPMEHAVSISLLPARLAGWLLAALGVLALVLSALGTYGVLSFLVRSRSKELAIRLAIGASPRQLGFMVIRQSLAWTGVGAAVGIGLALAVTRLVASFLYGVNPRDPLTFVLVAALIGAVACAAAFVPARRASQQDPLVTLRDA